MAARTSLLEVQCLLHGKVLHLQMNSQPCSLGQVSLPIIPNQLSGFLSALIINVKFFSEKCSDWPFHLQ